MDEPDAGQRSRSAPRTSPHPAPTRAASGTGTIPTQGRKKGTACRRCRTQKIRCDDDQPSCGNCARVNHPCVRPGLANDPGTLSHLSQVETRLAWLEGALRQVAPEKVDGAPSVSAPLHSAVSGASAIEAPLAKISCSPRSPATHQQPQHDGSTQSIGHLSQGVNDTPGSGTSPATAASTQIKPTEPLAHEVGLLSLANSKESKYLGPSSGVPFARLIFSAIPQSQGLATCIATPSNTEPGTSSKRAEPFPPDWVFEVDLHHFVDAYFETYFPLYPFLDEDMAHDWLQSLFDNEGQASGPFENHLPRLSQIDLILSTTVSVQFFLILALGSRTLEARLSRDFASERYFATAMSRLDALALHDSIEGLQIMLLLTLCSFNFVDGPNAWFLTSNIIASCLDLGFQRRWMEVTALMTEKQRQHSELRKTLRSGIFWSAYSLERQLAVVLGRPLTLRDEAIDVEFPGAVDGMISGTTVAATDSRSDNHNTSARSPKRAKIQVPTFLISHFSFRFDQILAEIKLTLHRVVNKPARFPWPTDTTTFQASMHKFCDELHNEVVSELKWQARRRTSDHATRSLEVKYHQCLMLLHRPSPAIPKPTLESWRICYSSAVKTLLVYAELQRFCKLNNSWLTAHNIFVCGITFLYCHWINPSLLQEVGISTFNSNAEICTALLRHLGKTWSVAADALNNFERLVQITLAAWKPRNMEQSTEMEAGHSLISMHQSQWQEDQRINHANGQPGNGDGSNPEPADFFHSNEFLGDFDNVEFGSFYTELGTMSSWFDLDWISQSQPFGEEFTGLEM